MHANKKTVQKVLASQQSKPAGLWEDAGKRLKKNRIALISLFIIAFYLLLALLQPILPLYPYEQQTLEHQYLPPSLKKAGDLAYQRRASFFKALAAKQNRPLNTAEETELLNLKNSLAQDPAYNRRYLLGTDSLGRDLLSRIISGSRISLAVGFVGAFASILLGVAFGSLAGWKGGKTDRFIMTFIEILYSLPYMLIVTIFMSLFGQKLINIFIAIALVSWLTIARLVRGQVMSLKNSEFVEAARVMGANSFYIILRHLAPNSLNIIIVFAALSVPNFIMSESFLSFLGLGVSAPLSSWGTLIREGVSGMELYPWLLLFPALSMGLFLFAMNFLGDGLRDALDPKGKNKN